MSDPIFDHVLYLVASSRDCLDEPLIYGPLRMVMNDRDAFAAWLDELLRQFAAEAKRRNLGST
jgi:hypothetical protein